jgi:hypothetical protein
MRAREFISEIVVGPETDDFIDNYQQRFDDAEIVKEYPSLDVIIKYKKGPYFDMYGVFKEELLISYLCINEISEYPCHQIVKTLTHPLYRKQGWIRCLLYYYVNEVGPLISDFHQSPNARDMWQWLIQTPGYLKLFHFNTVTKQKTQFSVPNYNLIIPNPWDGSRDVVILAETQYEDKNDLVLREQFIKNLNRYDFGPNTGSDKYPNP